MKHISRSVGHSKILGRMLELQGTSQTEVDEGTLKLFERARDEDDYLKVFRSGEVGSKVSRFEVMASVEQQKSESHNLPISELDPREPADPAAAFSWTRKFMEEVPELPRYNAAQRHVQFANYYGYQPSESATKNSAGSERATRADTPPGARSRRRPRSSDWLDARRRVFNRSQEFDDHRPTEDDPKIREDPSGQPMSLPSGT